MAQHVVRYKVPNKGYVSGGHYVMILCKFIQNLKHVAIVKNI